jgi:Predicted signal-transduction protein containing cAMP-binding and CBS domains
MTTVREVMSTDLVIVAPDTTVAEAATVMGTSQVGSAMVMEGGTLVGIFTERDVLRAVGSDFDAEHHAVSGFMTKGPHTSPADEEAHDALATMLAFGFRHLPVMDGAKVVGVVSMRDLTRALST